MRNPPAVPWDELKSTVRSKWAELTDEDVDEFDGRKEVLISKLEQRYGLDRWRAQCEVEEWLLSQPC